MTPAKGQLFYSSNTIGTIVPLTIGTVGYCLVVDATGVPVWSGACTALSSIGLSMPSQFSVSNSPLTANGTLGVTWASVSQNYGLFGPVSGSGVPTFRMATVADLPACGASGGSHSAGLVPDPGAGAGTTKYLREDCSFQTPPTTTTIGVKEVDGSPDLTGISVVRFDQAAGFTVTDNGSGVATVSGSFSGSGAIEVKEVDGSPDVTGVSIVRFDQADFSVTDNGDGTATIACSTCGGGSGTTATRQDQFDGDGGTTVFTLSAAPATNGIIYVSLNGLPQPTTAWTPSGSNITMGAAPISGALLAVGYYTALPGTVTHTQEDYSGAGSTDFTLSHTPATNGVLLVALRGLIQPQTSWSLVGGTTLRFSSSVPSGDAVSISYTY